MLVEMTPVPGAELPVSALAEHMRLSRGFADDDDLNAEIEQRCARRWRRSRRGRARRCFAGASCNR
jgi:hypothetical protein